MSNYNFTKYFITLLKITIFKLQVLKSQPQTYFKYKGIQALVAYTSHVIFTSYAVVLRDPTCDVVSDQGI
jgi:hypothetical protein